MSRPTLFLHSAGWCAVRRRKRDWPEGYSGRAFGCMPRPRQEWGHFGNGLAYHLLPDIRTWHRSRLDPSSRYHVTVDQARSIYNQTTGRWAKAGLLSPGELYSFDCHHYYNCRRRFTRMWALKDGDTLFSGAGKAAALEGTCHRSWAAWHLTYAGWRVVLEGERELQLGVDGAIVARELVA